MAQHQSFTPIVNPVGEMPSQPTKPGQTFTKTSLAANKQVNDKFKKKIVWFCLYLVFVLHRNPHLPCLNQKSSHTF